MLDESMSVRDTKTNVAGHRGNKHEFANLKTKEDDVCFTNIYRKISYI